MRKTLLLILLCFTLPCYAQMTINELEYYKFNQSTNRVKVETAETDAYVIANMDLGSTKYYGFVNAAGGWVIMKVTASGSVYTYTYASGSSAYSTNWTNRASLSYDTYDAVF